MMMMLLDARLRAGHLLSHVPVAVCSLVLSQYHADTRGPLGQCGCHHLFHVVSCHVMSGHAFARLFLSIRDSRRGRLFFFRFAIPAVADEP